jgi:hypothetical protein
MDMSRKGFQQCRAGTILTQANSTLTDHRKLRRLSPQHNYARLPKHLNRLAKPSLVWSRKQIDEFILFSSETFETRTAKKRHRKYQFGPYLYQFMPYLNIDSLNALAKRFSQLFSNCCFQLFCNVKPRIIQNMHYQKFMSAPVQNSGFRALMGRGCEYLYICVLLDKFRLK